MDNVLHAPNNPSQKHHSTISLPLPWDEINIIIDNNDDGIDIRNSETVFAVFDTGPLILAAPHGGNLLPPTIPDRTSGCMEPDTNSAQLAWAIFASVRRQQCGRAGCSPSLVVGKLHRRKVDLARARHSSAESGGDGFAAWDDYHSAIQQALDYAVARYGYAHLVDVHGQCHRDATEVGHMLTNSDLCGCYMDPQRSSISAMANLEDTFVSIENVVRGPHSIGTLLSKSGYAAVPSVVSPYPCCCDCECLNDEEIRGDGRKEKYCCSSTFDGDKTSNGYGRKDGYCRPCTAFDVKSWRSQPGGCGPCAFFWGANTLAMYGGGRTKNGDNGESVQLPRYRGKVAATQLETQWEGARETDAQIEEFASSVASAITGFMDHFYPPPCCGLLRSHTVRRRKKPGSNQTNRSDSQLCL